VKVMDFRIGDRVHVSGSGSTFAAYGEFFKENGLEEFKKDWDYGIGTPTGDYSVVATGKHHDSGYGTLYLLRGKDGKIYIMRNRQGDMALSEEGERKLKTWEMIKALTENPKLKFKSEDGHIASIFRTNFQLEYRNHNSNAGGNIRLLTEGGFKADEWELVPQPVSFTEAVKAAIEGKRPTIVLEGLRYTLIAEKSLRDIGYWLLFNCENGTTHSISTGMIDGLWTIED